MVACGGKGGELSFSPPSISWGEINFAEDPPEGGFDVLQIVVENTSDKDMEAQLSRFDFDHLCLLGFSSVPTALDTLGPGGTYALEVGVCGYSAENGERDGVVTGEIGVSAPEMDGEATASWSFTPVVRSGDDDTGN